MFFHAASEEGGGMIEIRVHGMGEHSDGSALGTPPLVAARYPDMPDTTVPPPGPLHPVRLINWSRTSRRHLRLLWYLALPFTLVNLMGYMTPEARQPRVARIVLRVAFLTVGIALTVTVLVWLIAIGETIMRPLEFANKFPEVSGNVHVIFVAALLAGTVVSRWARGDRILRIEKTLPGLSNERLWLTWTSLITLATVLGTGAAILFAPPTKWQSSLPFLRVPTPIDQVEFASVAGGSPSSAQLCEAQRGGEFTFVDRLDPLNAVVLAGLAIAALVWAALMITGYFGKRGVQGPLSGAALISVLAIVSLNAIGATLRLGVEWLMVYLDSLGSLGWIDGRATMSVYARHIVAYQGRRIAECRSESNIGYVYNSSYYLDSLPLFMILGGIALGAAFWLVNRSDYIRLWTQQRESGRKRRLLFGHVVILNLERRMGTAMLIAIPIWIALCALIWFFVDVHAGPSNLFWSDVVKVIAHVAAIGAVAFVIFGGRMGGVRPVLSLIADIAGFWDTCYHPFAGDTYRHHVLKGIGSDLEGLPREERVVLVGHSQGSVLVAWYVAHYTHRGLALVTCGSPLVSLYGLFFPRYFGSDLLGVIRSNSREWKNTWRLTDPIATPLLTTIGYADDDIELIDPPTTGQLDVVRGHSDYWTDPVQMQTVAALGGWPDSPTQAWVRTNFRAVVDFIRLRLRGRL